MMYTAVHPADGSPRVLKTSVVHAADWSPHVLKTSADVCTGGGIRPLAAAVADID